MGNAASGLPFVVGDEVTSFPESPETCSWRLHHGTKRVRACGKHSRDVRVPYLDRALFELPTEGLVLHLGYCCTNPI